MIQLFQNLQCKPAVQLHTGSSQQRPDRPCRSALLANDLTKIGRRHTQLENRDLFALNFANRHFIRDIHKRFGDLRY